MSQAPTRVSEIDLTHVALDRRYTPRERLQLRIAYRTNWVNHSDPNNLWGSNGRGLRFHLPSSTEPQRRPQIWASGDPKANRYWFPTLHAPGQLRTSELRATVRAPLRVVAGGRLLGTRDNADGTRTFHWATRTPEPEHRTTFAVGEFSDVAMRAGRVRLHNLGHPDETSGVAASVVQLRDTLRFLERLTGQRYPHASTTQVFVQDLPWNTVGSDRVVNAAAIALGRSTSAQAYDALLALPAKPPWTRARSTTSSATCCCW